jgi:hypothetical protein
MATILMSQNFPLSSHLEGYGMLEDAGMIRIEPRPTRRSGFASHSPSFDYSANQYADIILHIPSIASIHCASYDTSGQCRRKSIGFTRMSITSTSSFMSVSEGLPFEPEAVASTIKRVSSPTDFDGPHSEKNPSDLLKTRFKSVKLTPEDLILPTESVDECMGDPKRDDPYGVEVENDQASICSAIEPFTARSDRSSPIDWSSNLTKLSLSAKAALTSGLPHQLGPLSIDTAANSQPEFSGHQHNRLSPIKSKASSANSTPTAQYHQSGSSNQYQSASSSSTPHAYSVHPTCDKTSANTTPRGTSKVAAMRNTVAAARQQSGTSLLSTSQSEQILPMLSQSPSSTFMSPSVFHHSLATATQSPRVSPRATPRRPSNPVVSSSANLLSVTHLPKI